MTTEVENPDPLDVLIVDEKAEIDRTLLSKILLSFGRISPNGAFFPEKGFRSLNVDKKILVFLMARKALFLKKFIDAEETPPKAIIEQVGIKGGTVYPKLRELETERYVASTNGKYSIPNHAIDRIRELFGVSEHE